MLMRWKTFWKNKSIVLKPFTWLKCNKIDSKIQKVVICYWNFCWKCQATTVAFNRSKEITKTYKIFDCRTTNAHFSRNTALFKRFLIWFISWWNCHRFELIVHWLCAKCSYLCLVLCLCFICSEKSFRKVLRCFTFITFLHRITSMWPKMCSISETIIIRLEIATEFHISTNSLTQVPNRIFLNGRAQIDGSQFFTLHFWQNNTNIGELSIVRWANFAYLCSVHFQCSNMPCGLFFFFSFSIGFIWTTAKGGKCIFVPLGLTWHSLIRCRKKYKNFYIQRNTWCWLYGRDCYAH